MNFLNNILGKAGVEKQAEQEKGTSLDFVAIGDIVIDAFIKLKDAHEIMNAESHATELCMVFGTKLPFEFAKEVVAVGNSANAAVAVARMGLSSGLVGHVGGDENGEKCLKRFKEEHVSTEFIGVHPGMTTNYHYVLWFGTERTILIKHEDYPLSMPNIGSPKWLYLSSLGEHSLPFHAELASYLEAHPDIKLVFQPGTYQIKFGTDALASIYKRTELFFCNLEEAQIILKVGTEASDARDIKKLLAGIRALGPRIPVITDGPNGSYAYVTDETGAESAGHLAVYPDIAPPLERTGAGDAFASTFSAAIALGKSIPDAMKWASINSMDVCQKIGAQEGLLSRAQIEDYMAKAPTGWDVQKV